jgi:hypothetical protein
MTDYRPPRCRFRLKDEGKAYPRSSCESCGRDYTEHGSYCKVVGSETAIADPKVYPIVVLKDSELDRIRAAIGTVSVEEHDRRVTELLSANGVEVERRRTAERERDEALAREAALRAALRSYVTRWFGPESEHATANGYEQTLRALAAAPTD